MSEQITISGPYFKGPDKYLTNDGFPLGTTCWWSRVELDGHAVNVCEDTPESVHAEIEKIRVGGEVAFEEYCTKREKRVDSWLRGET